MRPILPVVILAAALLASPAFADWKSFIHGEPPPFVKAPPPKQLAAVSTLPGVQPDPQVESFMRVLADAVMAREGSMILPRLSERYAVDGAPGDAKAADFMVQAIGKMPGPERIVIRSVEASGGTRIAKTEFHFGLDNVKVKTFRFDADGKLLESDLFSLRRG
jgi:hypothetical protein